MPWKVNYFVKLPLINNSRWHNHLDPDIKKDPISANEEKMIFEAHKKYGNKWADIAKLMVGRYIQIVFFIFIDRSDNCIKNYYYSTLRKHLRRINKGLKMFNIGILTYYISY